MEAIEARATLKHFRISPQKTRLVADLIRGQGVEQAKKTLAFTQKKAARVLLKLLNSAIANAEDKSVEDTEILMVSEIWVSQGPVQKRYMPRARGKADVLRKPSSHVTIIVKEDLEAKKAEEARRAEQEAKRAKKRAAKKKAGSKKADDKNKKDEAPAVEKATAKSKKAADAGKDETPAKKATTKKTAVKKAKAEPSAVKKDKNEETKAKSAKDKSSDKGKN